MPTIKSRVMQLLEYKRIPKENFFEKIGSVSSNFRSKAAETPLGSDKIANILAEIPDVNLEWLITGNGQMLNVEPRTAAQRAADDLASKTKRLEDVGNMILGAREQTGPVSTENEVWLRSVIDDQRRQINGLTDANKSQARTIEKLASKGDAADVPGVAGMAAKG